MKKSTLWVKTLSYEVTFLDIGTLCFCSHLHFAIHLAPGALDHAPFAAGAIAWGAGNFMEAHTSRVHFPTLDQINAT